jgi:hypothetical protein
MSDTGALASGEATRELELQWPVVRRVFWKAFLSSIHYAIASVDSDGAPHVTPIGTVILTQPCRGIFFQRYTARLPQHLKQNNRVCILAVDTGRLMWARALLTGRFPRPPAVRLYGTVGPLRRASDEELQLWRRRVAFAKPTRGYQLIWRDMTMVRDLYFTHARGVEIGPMPAGLDLG